jgi:hypothetical protein
MEAVAVRSFHQPGSIHHQTGTCTTCGLFSAGLAAIEG